MLQYCHHVNTQFGSELPFTEVRATAQSISRWIWRNFTEESYRARQAELGRRGGTTMTPKKIEANRKRATRYDRSAVHALAL